MPNLNYSSILCSFCGMSADQVPSMIAAAHHRSNICEDCVIQCMEILRYVNAAEIEYLSWFAAPHPASTSKGTA